MARRVTANNNPKNSVMTDLNLAQAVEVVRANPSTSFAADLVAAYDRYRDKLHGNKAAWLLVIGQQVLDRRNAAPAPVRTALTADFAGLTAIFTRALASGKKYPKIALRTAGGLPLVLSLAGERSRYAGAVNVTDGGKYPDNVYYGRIEPNGAFAGRDPGPDVMGLLLRFAADPQGVAAAYGRETGECCFCQAELTDERSVLQGYGPICAERHGLPWGERPDRLPAQPVPTDFQIEQAARERRDRQHAAHFAALERQREQAGFLSDPDFRRAQVAYDHRLTSQPVRQLEFAFAGVDAPWRDDD